MTGFDPDYFWQHLESLLPNELQKLPLKLCVGFSGGLDSTVLLKTLSTLRTKHTFSLRAIHVNHQLQPDAPAWSNFCRTFCENENIDFQNINVDVVQTKELGPEAAARKARYTAIKNTIQENEIFLTAHHLDDQIETLFLQLLRGAGIDGASAIKPVTQHDNYYLLRPLLAYDRCHLSNYAESNKLSWVEDPSNSEKHYNRNYLRHDVLPLIEKRWPAYRKVLQRFVEHSQSTVELLEGYSKQDFDICYSVEDFTLSIEKLNSFSIEKQSLILRHWIKQQNFLMPGEAQLAQIHKAIVAVPDANPLVKWAGAELRRYQNKLYLLPQNHSSIDLSEVTWDLKQPRILRGIGKLISHTVVGYGIKPHLVEADITISFRKGGEKCRPVGRQGSHSLKKLFQEYAIPPWRRRQIPLLKINDAIIAVPGYFYCEPFAALKEEEGIAINLELV